MYVLFGVILPHPGSGLSLGTLFLGSQATPLSLTAYHFTSQLPRKGNADSEMCLGSLPECMHNPRRRLASLSTHRCLGNKCFHSALYKQQRKSQRQESAMSRCRLRMGMLFKRHNVRTLNLIFSFETRSNLNFLL